MKNITGNAFLVAAYGLVISVKLLSAIFETTCTKMNENLKYNDKKYWDKRYNTEESYEWFQPYTFFQSVIRNHIKPTDKILILGCGNSNLSEDMYNDGFHHILNIDYSPVVIEKMKTKSAVCSQMQWEVADIREMDFPTQSFDVILEKGTLDALLVEERDPWNLSDEMKETMDRILVQVSRVLKSNGRFLSISFRQPHFQRLLFDMPKYGWTFNYSTLGDFFHYFVYISSKNQQNKIMSVDI